MNKYKKKVFFWFKDYGVECMQAKREKELLIASFAYDYYMQLYGLIKDVRQYEKQKREFKESLGTDI